MCPHQIPEHFHLAINFARGGMKVLPGFNDIVRSKAAFGSVAARFAALSGPEFHAGEVPICHNL
jgi:hypothetical protein